MGAIDHSPYERQVRVCSICEFQVTFATIDRCPRCGFGLDQPPDEARIAEWHRISEQRLKQAQQIQLKVEEEVFERLRESKLVSGAPNAEAVLGSDDQQTGSDNRVARLRLFGGSLFAFLIVGWLITLIVDSFGIWDLFILVMAVLIHETGHYLGMRHYGYKNLKMFFIPIFGAAVSGSNVQISVVEEAIVFLLGPVPGLLIGYVCGVLFLVTQVEFWRQLAWVFIVLNGFNLLPLYPLDGGQYVFGIFSGRSIRSDTLLQVFLTLLTIAAGFSMGWTSLAVIGFALVFKVRRLLKLNRIAYQLRAECLVGGQENDGMIPKKRVQHIITAIRQEIPELSKPEEISEAVIYVYGNSNTQRLSLNETRILLTGYGILLFSLVAAFFVYQSHIVV